MKNIYLVAAALAVFAFSACSDDKDDSVDVCKISKIPNTGDLEICIQDTESISKADCEEGATAYGGTGSIASSCSGDSRLKCPMEEGGYVYLYGQMAASIPSCEAIPFPF